MQFLLAFVMSSSLEVSTLLRIKIPNKAVEVLDSFDPL